MTSSLQTLLLAATMTSSVLFGGCVTEETDDAALDPSLEQIDDGKYDGPVLPVDRSGEYSMDVGTIETTQEYGAWTVKPDLYLTVADARTASCPDPSHCNFDLADAMPGQLQLGTSERVWSGDELRDGVEFAIHNRYTNSGGSVVDEVLGLTKIKIGSTGSLKIKPFGRVKSITFRVRF